MSRDCGIALLVFFTIRPQLEWWSVGSIRWAFTLSAYHPDQLTDEAVISRYSQADIVAEITHRDGRVGVQLRKNEVPKLELEKLLEDVRWVVFSPCISTTSNDR